jgi:ADP-ribosyl-[dinitrogen reductase] hydrolase
MQRPLANSQADGGEFAAGELAPLRALRDRYQGALQGLLLGDALAAATQLRRPGSFTPVGDLLGGGPFDLPRGAWADEGAMALCCAASLADCEDFDAHDQRERLRRWKDEGEHAATGQCLGITAATARALAQGADGAHAAPEVLSRIAPVVMAAQGDAARTQEWAAAAVALTCAHPRALDAGRALAAMLHAALRGEPLAGVLRPAPAHFGGRRPGAAVAALLDSDPLQQPLAGPGLDAVGVLALARWCLASAAGCRDALLRAANLGHDSDPVAATCGQLAGAHFGCEALPRGWRQALAGREQASELADRLLGIAMVAQELGAGARRA